MNGARESEPDDHRPDLGDAGSFETGSFETGSLEAASHPEGEVLPYRDLMAPTPLRADPPVVARWLAFGSILLGGLLGALIGYGVLDLFTGSPTWSAVGALGFGVGGAVGLGIVTSLTLRAMNEWKEVQHPERAARDAANRNAGTSSDASRGEGA